MFQVKITVSFAISSYSLVFGFNQAVVASLACDPNVWNAVMENSAVSSFFQSQQSGNLNSYSMCLGFVG